MTINPNGRPEVLSSVTNDAKDIIEIAAPFIATIDITGTSAILFHRWSDDAVEAKAKAAKGSAAKKTDDVDSYVWRNASNEICLPGEYVRQSIINPQNGAAKYRQDPRSPRKSALDLYKAGVVALTDLAPIYRSDIQDSEAAIEWDYLDRRRVVIQRSAVTRSRPAFHEGWRAQVQLMVLTPEYISPADLHAVLSSAGRLVGVGDFRPTFGRFRIDKYDIGLE